MKKLHEGVIYELRKTANNSSADQYWLRIIEELKMEKIELVHARRDTDWILKAYKGLKRNFAKGKKMSVEINKA